MKSVRLAALLVLVPFAAVRVRAEEWTTFERCRLVARDYKDGDSFHVRNEKGRKYIFRLYFVDAPESDDRFPERLKEQGDYFGGLGAREVERLGEEASRFTDKFLAGEFTVRTRYHDALGTSDQKRYYAILEKDGVSLAEALVERGLARLHGVVVTPPGAGSEKAYLLRLKGKENDARKAGLGGWAKLAAARGAAARGAPPAAWQVAEQDAALKVGAVLQSVSPPHGVAGTLPAGTPVRVLGSATYPGKVRIRFERGGQPVEALVDRVALGL